MKNMMGNITFVNDAFQVWSDDDGGSMFLWNSGIYVQVHMVLQPQRPRSTLHSWEYLKSRNLYCLQHMSNSTIKILDISFKLVSNWNKCSNSTISGLFMLARNKVLKINVKIQTTSYLSTNLLNKGVLCNICCCSSNLFVHCVMKHSTITQGKFMSSWMCQPDKEIKCTINT
jgi:hypothetical protein